MRTIEDVERYLLELDTPYEVLGEGIYRLTDDVEDVDDIIVLCTDPLVIFSVRLMKVPSKNLEAFYRKLLELNASELVAGAYGIDGDDVVITDTLQLENLDFNEFQASIDSLVMAIHNHYPVLREFMD
ncbi:MAG: YbjN domain-containing protein [Proteobacteria bacterium]|nr:YbjN domain-containing protein [Pseudomonadota bacterium]